MQFEYPPIEGTSLRIARDGLQSIASISDLPELLAHQPSPVTGGKNLFGFWNTGLKTLPPYLQRNVSGWYNRLHPLGWNVYIVDVVPGSPFNIGKFIDTTSSKVVPAAFMQGKLTGEYAAQHTSDLVRYPLLLKYGGVYMDMGILLFSNIDEIWTKQISNPSSPIDFAGFTIGDPPSISLMNFTLIARANNPLLHYAHRILLSLWDGKTETTGMHTHPLVIHCDMLRVPKEIAESALRNNNLILNDEMMTDYAIQVQCMGSAQRWEDPESGWDGPKYMREHCLLLTIVEAATKFEQITGWNGRKSFQLLSQNLPANGETETEDQQLARYIVEETVTATICMKLPHGFSTKLFGGDTLGTLWRKNVGSDCAEGTYAGWLRWAESNLDQNEAPRWWVVPEYKPTKVGRMDDYLTKFD